MSSVYILEPPTAGKVLLQTTVGDIDIELFSKEAPKACRNFIQLCLEGYYNDTVFHRVSLSPSKLRNSSSSPLQTRLQPCAHFFLCFAAHFLLLCF